MPLIAFCDAYSFWMRSGMVSGALTCRLLCVASARLSALQLVILRSLQEWSGK
jgi:hypothetical protein